MIAGGTGLLGPYLVSAGARLGHCLRLSRGRVGDVSCDLCDANRLRRVLAELRPALVVNAVALTDVDRCEAEPALADRLNRLAVSNLIATMPADAMLVQISTDQVYPDSAGPHSETDVAPVNVYGRTKLAGEMEALRRESTLVLRVNFFGPSRTPGRQSLSDLIASKLRARQSMVLFQDVLFSPLHMTTLSDTLFRMAERRMRGVFNLGCRDGVSKHAFGLMVAAKMGLPTSTAHAGYSTDIPGRVKRALDLRMDVSRIEAALGEPMHTLGQEVSTL